MCIRDRYELGVCYETGDGVGKDEAKAAELYRKAAVQGYAEAQNLSLIHISGCFAAVPAAFRPAVIPPRDRALCPPRQ